jgi:chromosome segregation protein
MRLTKLKLAGFKSFVDPTTLALPGQLVGVVGPNGCGKSNVMDSVRWVLGESKASELRGESMQDVIFNGSGTRKPVSRAAVELVFDNTLGRLAGQWSQYAELSVKRLLTRNGQSEYYINNLHVRRKDVTDLFLGTGLGPRAYAIIGQGTISRIIEAKPDELRVFLEEAAGVTRYKERRKETENRLADTRENLARVEDIRLELGSQMERLEGQASVARQYREYHDELTRKQQLQWLLRRNEAQLSVRVWRVKSNRRASTSKHGTRRCVTSKLRLEEAREAHFAASDGVHAAQSDLFAANAEVARLEAEIRHRRESRREYETRLAQLTDERRHWQAQAARLASDDERWQGLLVSAEERVEQGRLPSRSAAGALAAGRGQARRRAGGRQSAAHRRWPRPSSDCTSSRPTAATRSVRCRSSPAAANAWRSSARPCRPPTPTSSPTGRRNSPSCARASACCWKASQRQQQELPLHEQQRRTVLGRSPARAEGTCRGECPPDGAAATAAAPAGNGNSTTGCAGMDCSTANRCGNRCTSKPAGKTPSKPSCASAWCACRRRSPTPAWSKDRPGSKLTLLLPLAGGLRGGSCRSLLHAHTLRRPAVLSAILADWLGEVLSAPIWRLRWRSRSRLSASACCVTPGGDIVSRQSVTLFAPDKPPGMACSNASARSTPWRW